MIQDLGLAGLAGTFLWPQTFAAVYDGHGGGQASEYLWGNLHTKVCTCVIVKTWWCWDGGGGGGDGIGWCFFFFMQAGRQAC